MSEELSLNRGESACLVGPCGLGRGAGGGRYQAWPFIHSGCGRPRSEAQLGDQGWCPDLRLLLGRDGSSPPQTREHTGALDVPRGCEVREDAVV